MNVAGDTIRLSDSQTLTVRARSAAALELESTWTTSPKSPPMHWHPNQDEEFEVVEGELTVRLGHGSPQILAAGETLTIPSRTPHCMWNGGPTTTRAVWRITPPLRTEQLFRFMEQGTGGLRGPRMLLTYRAEFRLGAPKPGRRVSLS